MEGIVIPEIVEVQIQVDGLQELVGATIQDVVVEPNAEVILMNIMPEQFANILEDSIINRIFRHGKYIVWEVMKLQKAGPVPEYEWVYVVTHLTMTGGFYLNKYHPHTRITYGTSKHILYYKDTRKWSNIGVYSAEQLLKHFERINLGIDVLNETVFDIEKGLIEKVYDKKYRNRPIKDLLLDQQILSGLGNIYACEVLHMAQIHPLTAPAELDWGHMQQIAESTKFIIKHAYREGGSSISDYENILGGKGNYQNFHRVYGRKGKYCGTCTTTLVEAVKIQGRNSFFCPNCQPYKIPF